MNKRKKPNKLELLGAQRLIGNKLPTKLPLMTMNPLPDVIPIILTMNWELVCSTLLCCVAQGKLLTSLGFSAHLSVYFIVRSSFRCLCALTPVILW